MTITLFSMPVFAESAALNKAQDYIDDAPITVTDFLASPIKAIGTFLSDAVRQAVDGMLRGYGEAILFLVLSGAVLLLIPEKENRPLLEMVATGGCYLLISDELVALVTEISEQSGTWRDFIAAFVPVFSAVTAASGQITSAAVYGGFFLTCIGLLTQILESIVLPATKLYLAASAASAYSGSTALGNACEAAGQLLRKMIGAAGWAFSLILGLQRVFALSADTAISKAGRTVLTGAVPIVGQTISLAAQTVAAGVHTVQAGLGFAALAILGATFLPLYLRVIVSWLMTQLAQLTARLLGLNTAAGLLKCTAIGLESIAALLALFYGMVAVSTFLMIGIGNGG